MAKKNQNYYLSLLNQAIAAANTPSQYENAANQDYTNLRNFLTPTGRAPDFRDPKGAGVVTGMLDKSEYDKQRRQLRGMPSTDRQQDDLASRQTQLADNQFDADYGNAYQDAIGNLGGVNQNQATNLMDVYNQRTGLGIQGAQAGLQAFLNKKPSMWSQMLPGLIQGGADVGLSYLSQYLGGRGSGTSAGGHGQSGGGGQAPWM